MRRLPGCGDCPVAGAKIDSAAMTSVQGPGPSGERAPQAGDPYEPYRPPKAPLEDAPALESGSVSGGRSGSRAGTVRWLGAALLIAAIGFGYQQWHSAQQVREFEDLDLHLLASDLPIDAYLDRGFQNWLRASFEY